MDTVFDARKIAAGEGQQRIKCSNGQVLYEWEHLRSKLKQRDPGKHKELEQISAPDAHTLFEIVAGEVEALEIAHVRSTLKA